MPNKTRELGKIGLHACMHGQIADQCNRIPETSIPSLLTYLKFCIKHTYRGSIYYNSTIRSYKQAFIQLHCLSTICLPILIGYSISIFL